MLYYIIINTNKRVFKYVFKIGYNNNINISLKLYLVDKL